MSETSDPTLFDTLPKEAGEVHLKPSLEHAYDQGVINMTQARQLSGHVMAEHEAEVVAPVPEASERQLELVIDDHVPKSDARREAKLQPPRKPRNWHERMAADQAPPHQRVTPLGHDPILTIHQGGKRKTH